MKEVAIASQSGLEHAVLAVELFDALGGDLGQFQRAVGVSDLLVQESAVFVVGVADERCVPREILISEDDSFKVDALDEFVDPSLVDDYWAIFTVIGIELAEIIVPADREDVRFSRESIEGCSNE